jgi:hypothetical protein
VWSYSGDESTQLANEWAQSVKGIQGERNGVDTINKGTLTMRSK